MRTAQGEQQSDPAEAEALALPSGRGGPRGTATRGRRVAAEPDDREVLAAQVASLHLGPGLHVVEIAELGDPLGMLQGLELPVAHVAALPGENDEVATIVANSAGTGPWLPLEGGTIVVRTPPDGGDLLVTVYAPGDATCPVPRIAARRLDRERVVERPGRAGGAVQPLARVVPTEVVLHIHRVGDRRFVGEGWFGARGQRLHIEAFSIRPADSLAASDIEFMGFGSGNRQTPWVTEGRLCGTRGRGLPLTGFAVRLTPAAQRRFDVAYEGAFIESGVVGPSRNGEPCLPPVPDDPLEAINIRITERSPGVD